MSATPLNMQPYYMFRPEVAKYVPGEARTVIDVGCGEGALGRGLKAQRPELEVRGIEIDPVAATIARAHLDDVVCANAEAPLPAEWPRPDCVVFADVLEHLVDPWQCLKLWRDRLPNGTTLIVSLPNAAHFSLWMPLLRGRWDYCEDGILDRTHLRFFTRDTGAEMLRAAGFRIERFERLWRLPRGIVRTPGALARRLVRNDGLLPRPGLHFADVYSIQYLFVAR
jgi:2-polyprenyl-3-methyl-5-hydroxy-6-metoxy-1,4-benzoquinol methylase